MVVGCHRFVNCYEYLQSGVTWGHSELIASEWKDGVLAFAASSVCMFSTVTASEEAGCLVSQARI